MQAQLAKKVISAAQHIEKYGYAVIKNFISPEKCDQAMKEIDRLVN